MSFFSFIPQRKWLFIGFRVVIAVTTAIIICQFRLDYLEALTYDFRVRLKPTTPPSGAIHLVTIDNHRTLRENKGQHPSAKDHARMLRNLIAQQPRAIVYTFNPEELEGGPADFEELGRVAQSTDSLYFGSNEVSSSEEENLPPLNPPLANFKVYPFISSMADNRIFARDGVTRRFLFSFENKPTLHAILASTYSGKTQPEDYQGLFQVIDTIQGYIDFRPSGTYPTTNFLNLLYPTESLPDLKDKLVLIGLDTRERHEDYIITPLSRQLLSMPTLEMHANMLDTLITNSSPIRAPNWVNLLITSLITIITLHVVLSLRPARGLILLGLILFGFCLFAYVGFAFFDLWIQMAHPILAIFVCYYFFIPYRLIMENRNSWEYYQKNRLLTQVEELKSNFLRMMSHDLKTPLARIQGMTHVVMADEHPLSNNQKQALETIHRSSEELEDFIGSILNLGRIESQEIKLQLRSKDINTLMTEVIDKCEFLAKKKNIQILSEFEPMFSIKIDEDLVRQVFTNLVENAIKYSPENSRILVTTEEHNGKIIVQVADQGIGIPSEDVPHIFTKFYRSQSVKNSSIGGSGLGLYLSKYFVELHQGDIKVESLQQKGSTFTVELPMDLGTQLEAGA